MLNYFFCIILCGSNKWISDSDSDLQDYLATKNLILNPDYVMSDFENGKSSNAYSIEALVLVYS